MLGINSLRDIHALVTRRHLSVMDAVEVTLQRARKGKRWHGWFDVEGSILGKPFKQVAENSLYNQGEQDVLEGFFRNASLPANFAIGLLKTSYTLLITDTMTQIGASELTNAADGGYGARQTVTRDATGWPTSALAGGYWQLTSLQVTWTATGAWSDTAGYMFVMSGGSTTPGNTTGRVVAVAALSPTRQLQAVNDNIKVTYNLKLQ